MALNFQNNDDEPGLMVEMNTTPLIDVMLVLLVMLIITIPLQMQSVNLELPGGVSPPQLEQPSIVRITVTGANQILWDAEPIADAMALDAHMRAAAAQAQQPEIHVHPDATASYDTVAAVLATAQRDGLVKIGIVDSEQAAQ